MKNLIYVERNDVDSIYHDITGQFGSASVLLMTAVEGTGIIAGGPARAVLELAGIRNIILLVPFLNLLVSEISEQNP